MKNSIQPIKQIIPILLIEFFILFSGGLLIFVIISLFIPFPYLPKIRKILLIIFSFLIYSIFIVIIKLKYVRQFNDKISLYLHELKSNWFFHVVYSTIITFLLLTLITYYQPVVPLKYPFSLTSEELSIPSLIYSSWSYFYNFARGFLIFFTLIIASIYIKLKFPNKKDQLVIFPLTFFLFLIFLSSINFQNELVNIFNHNYLILFYTILFFILIPLIINIILRKFPQKEFVIFLIVLFSISGVQIFYIMNIPNMQVGDFFDFNDLAIKLALGETNISIGLYRTFIKLLSLFYRIHPSALTAKFINIVLTIISMTSLYLIGKKIDQSNSGITSAYIFGMLPTQSGMVAIVNNDIPSITLLILIALFSISYFKDTKWYWLALCAFLFGIAFQLRSTLLIYSPILILPIIYNNQYSIKIIFHRLSTIILGLITSIILISLFISTNYGADVGFRENKNILYTLLNGTNINYGGRNNYPDQVLIRSLPQERLLQEVLPIVFDRIFSNPINYYDLLNIKYSYLFGDATYTAGYVLNFEANDLIIFEDKWGATEETIYQNFAKFCQYSYIIVSGVSILFIFLYKKSYFNVSLMGLIIFICAFLFYAIFEVQPRYNRPIIPFLVFFASSALSELFNNANK